MDKTELIKIVQELSQELGRAPLFREFDAHLIGGQNKVRKTFGTFNNMLKEAGLEKSSIRKQDVITRAESVIDRKIDNSIFEKDIVTHLQNFEPSEKIPNLEIKFESTVIFGDLHFPFIHQKKLEKALDVVAKIKPVRVIQIGDLYDMLSHGKFPRSLNIYTPKEEMALGRKGAVAFWENVRKIVPKSECHQILGNHDQRPMKRILEQYPEAELFMDFEKWFKFDGVNTIMDLRQELILDGIAYIHGYRSKLGEHMEYMRRPVICGHSHRAGIVYKNYGDQTLFEMNVGYLGDPESKALSYTAQKHTHWTHSLGIINEFGPQVIFL